MTSALRGLYPFLHGDRKDPGSEAEALVESVRQKTAHGASVAKAFFEQNAGAVVEAARAIAGVYRRNGKMLAMGNGGSSCDATHFAVEYLHPITTGRPSLPVLSLVMDPAILTAIGNDVGMQHVFRRQVEVHGRSGDGLIGFSTSGNSDNLMAAYHKAKEMGLVTLGLTGGDGGQMRSGGLVDHCLAVETDSIHRVQEVHVAIYHLLWDLTHTLLADDRAGHVMRPVESER